MMEYFKLHDGKKSVAVNAFSVVLVEPQEDMPETTLIHLGNGNTLHVLENMKDVVSRLNESISVKLIDLARLAR